MKKISFPSLLKFESLIFGNSIVATQFMLISLASARLPVLGLFVFFGRWLTVVFSEESNTPVPNQKEAQTGHSMLRLASLVADHRLTPPVYCWFFPYKCFLQSTKQSHSEHSQRQVSGAKTNSSKNSPYCSTPLFTAAALAQNDPGNTQHVSGAGNCHEMQAGGGALIPGD